MYRVRIQLRHTGVLKAWGIKQMTFGRGFNVGLGRYFFAVREWEEGRPHGPLVDFGMGKYLYDQALAAKLAKRFGYVGPKIEKVDDEFWVDSGIADIGPFANLAEAEASIRRMVSARDEPLGDDLERRLSIYRAIHT